MLSGLSSGVCGIKVTENIFYKMKSFHFPDADNFETAFSVSD